MTIPHQDPAEQRSAAAPARGSTDFLQALLDELAFGLVVCDGLGALQLSNHAARHEAARGGLLGIERGCLVRQPGVGGDLDAAMRQAAQRGRRSLVRLARGGDRLLLHVLPLPGGAGGPLVMVMMGRRQACSDLGLEMLASAHGLTLAEHRVLAGLVHDMTPSEIARRHDVEVTTVRTQILSIRAKLDARSITAVLLRAAGVPPMAHALRLAGAAAHPERPDGAGTPTGTGWRAAA